MGEIVANIQVSSFEKLDAPEFNGSITYDIHKHGSIQELIARSPNGTYIEIPEGNYFEDIVINKIIYLKGVGDVNIYGCGKDSSTIISQSQYLLLDGINVYGYMENRGGIALTVESGYTCLVDCVFVGMKKSAVGVIGAANVEMYNCLCNSGSEKYSVSLQGGSHFYAEKSIFANSYAGIRVDGSSATIIGCRVKNNKHGMELVNSSSAVAQYSIFDENITNLLSANAGNSVFSNCIMTSRGTSGLILQEKSNAAFVQCSLKRTGNETSQNPKFIIINQAHLSFINSELDCDGYDNSQIVALKGTLLIENSIIKELSQGIIMQECQFTIKGLTLECANKSPGSAIQNANSTFNFDKLSIRNYAMPMVLNNTKGQVTQSTFDGMTGLGVKLVSCEMNFDGTEFLNSKEKCAVYLHEKSNINFNNCTFRNSTERAIIVIGGSTAVVNGSNFAECDTGIYANGGSSSVSESTFEGCKMALHVSQSAAALQKCTVRDCRFGIAAARQSEVTAQSTYFIDCKDAGVFAEQARVTLASCQLAGCLIAVKANQAAVVAQQCDIGSSLSIGVALVASKAHIEQSILHDDAKAAVYMQGGAGLTLVGSNVTSSGSSGLVVTEASAAEITGCQFAGNQGPSVFLNTGCQLQLKNSRMQDPLAVQRLSGSTFVEDGNQFDGVAEKLG